MKHNDISSCEKRESFNLLKALVFLPVIFYPPLVFNVPVILRVFSFSLLVVYLLLATRRFLKGDAVLSICLTVLLVSAIFINYQDEGGMRTAASTMLTLTFAWLLRRGALLNKNVKERMVRFYTFFFLVIPVCTILSPVFFYLVGEYNLLALDDGGHSTYIFTPMGALLAKDFFGLGALYRSFAYFNEPVFLALFCAANIFLVAPYLGKKAKLFALLNIVAGILTFSYLFLGLALIFYFTKRIKRVSWKSVIYMGLFAAVLFGLYWVDIFAASSIDDRLLRITYFIDAMRGANWEQQLFGHGFAQETGFERGFSGGLFTTIYEMGIINLIGITYFVYRIANRNINILLLFIIGELVIEPIKLPLFWLLVIVVTVLWTTKRDPSPKIKRELTAVGG